MGTKPKIHAKLDKNFGANPNINEKQNLGKKPKINAKPKLDAKPNINMEPNLGTNPNINPEPVRSNDNDDTDVLTLEELLSRGRKISNLKAKFETCGGLDSPPSVESRGQNLAAEAGATNGEGHVINKLGQDGTG